MNQTLSLATRQNVSISPRLQHAIRLLQLSALDFERELRDSLASNPFLEEPEEPPADGAAAPAQDSGGEPPLLGSAFERPRTPRATSEADGADLSWAPDRPDLREYLLTQLYASRQPPRMVLAAAAVIESLDDDGYLRDEVYPSLEGLEVDPPLTPDEVEHAIELVRAMDPPGVGARDLADCLCLQLAAVDDASAALRELARTIVRSHIELLARHDVGTLALRLSCGEVSVREACALIRRLDPHPGTRYSPNAPDYIIPDVLVVRRRGSYQALLNPEVRPRARLNQRYVELLRSCRGARNPGLAQQLQEARWFLRNAEQRFETIQCVADCIIRHQHGFLEYGDIALKPMVLCEVADELGLHESTVSRATNNKHMQTPRGCYAFKHFFSRELPMRNGPACSATAVRAIIREIIAEEAPSRPLSDVDIAAQLRAQGIRIARRTVTKYRRMLRLPPADLRRRA